MPAVFAPLVDAVKRIGTKRGVRSTLRTEGWDDVPLALRERAQFSAGIESARYLQRIDDSLQELITNQAGAARQSIVRDLVEIAKREGLRPERGQGGLTDHGSQARTELIVNTQTEQAYGFASWKAGQDADALDVAPAQRFLRVESREVPRDWKKRWREAGGKMYGGEMVALKDDPVWTKLSRFGTPWPPFDFGSGMGVEDVMRSEAEAMGVMPQDAPSPMPGLEKFNDGLEASASGLSDELKGQLKKHFGNQITISGDTARWNNKATL
jgi:hypothetical protein